MTSSLFILCLRLDPPHPDNRTGESLAMNGGYETTLNREPPPVRFCLTIQLSCSIISLAEKIHEAATRTSRHPGSRRIQDASPSPWRSQQGEIHLLDRGFCGERRDSNAAWRTTAPCASRAPWMLTLYIRVFGSKFHLTSQGPCPIIILATKATAAVVFGLPAEYKTASSHLEAGIGGKPSLRDRGFCGRQPESIAVRRTTPT